MTIALSAKPQRVARVLDGERKGKRLASRGVRSGEIDASEVRERRLVTHEPPIVRARIDARARIVMVPLPV